MQAAGCSGFVKRFAKHRQAFRSCGAVEATKQFQKSRQEKPKMMADMMSMIAPAAAPAAPKKKATRKKAAPKKAAKKATKKKATKRAKKAKK
jgi:hypothetical protein